jgi:hypothetical protein
MYGSPLALCPVCKEYVALDETPKECAAQHHCDTPSSHCPLRKFFTGTQSCDRWREKEERNKQ